MGKQNRDYFKLFSCCLLAKGFLRSIIVDHQRQTYDFIPNSLYEILTVNKSKSLDQIKSIYDSEYHEIIDEYFAFLSSKEYIHFCKKNELVCFPEMSHDFNEPALITNSIIDFNEYSNFDILPVLKQLESLGCRNIEFRMFNSIKIDELCYLLDKFENTAFSCIMLVIKYSVELDELIIKEIVDKFIRINTVTVYSAPVSQIVKLDSSGMGNIVYIQQHITDASHCGFISPEIFSLDLVTYLESQKHNTCLNRKISIDVNGEIKNCPSMIKSYGNIKDTTLKEAIEKQGFKDVWFIHKDQIEVCKDCEFRHICTDCRVYIQNPNDIYSKPAKCSYDPYTATWGDANLTNNPLYGN